MSKTVDHEADKDYRADSRSSSPKKKRDMTKGTFWREMFSLGIHRRQQGRIARQVTFGALALMVGAGCWRLSDFLIGDAYLRIGLPLVLFAVGAWVAYRLVNYPPFADFLINVEAEMVKVSWPTRTELFRSSVVVILTIFGLAAILALYDVFWQWFLRLLGVIR
jgi:preprotein translocase subunit SecE